MDSLAIISSYIPQSDQEEQDKKVMLALLQDFPDSILTRRNEVAHFTSSGFILNPNRDKALMVHHNIRNTWSWTGGHADGERDFLAVALREAKEETGVEAITPLGTAIASLDIFAVAGHYKNQEYVSSHLHLSVAYMLIAEEQQPLRSNAAENSAVRWFALDDFTPEIFSPRDLKLYAKLIRRGHGSR